MAETKYTFTLLESDFETLREIGELDVCMDDGTWIKMVYKEDEER